MAFDKHRFRFRKDGELRFVSHLDLMRAFERMLRRARLPFRSTEGFHPQPRLVFAQSLSLGIAGLNEVVEIEYLEPVEPDEAIARLTDQAPPGLAFSDVRRIELKSTARPALGRYRLLIPETLHASVAEACARLLESAEVWVERERPRLREVNIRHYLHDMAVRDGALHFDVWISQDGTARADEIIRVLGLSHVVDEGGIVERTYLLIDDELDEITRGARPKLPGRDERINFERPLPVGMETLPALPTAPPGHWGASPHGPIIE